MTAASGDFALTLDELRVVARYALDSADRVLPVFEDACPDDRRPRVALEAAREFADGGPRTKRQRVTSLDAHRAARDAPTEVAQLAARSAGDAASAAYLHPLARADQVGHILRAAASAARIAELTDGADARQQALEVARRRATPTLIDVLSRYPRPGPGTSPVSRLMSELDGAVRG